MLSGLVAFAETASTLSNIITVDTRGGTTVRGQMVDGTPASGPYLPLAEVTVAVGSATAVTGADGTFSISADLTSPDTFSATMEGFMTYTATVEDPAEGDVVDLGLIPLHPEVEGPYVEWVRQEPEGFFLQGWGVKFDARARVNWNGYTPESVKFLLNGHQVGEFEGTGVEYSYEFSVDEDFAASLQEDGNEISVVAVGAPPEPEMPTVSSDPVLSRCVVLPTPEALNEFIADPANVSSEAHSLNLKFSFPTEKPIKSYSVPVIGSVIGEVIVAGRLNYNFRSRQWIIEAGGRFDGVSETNSRFKLGIGSFDNIKAEIKGKGTGTATVSKGIDLSKFEITATLGVEGEYAIGILSPYGIVGPGLAEELLDTPLLGAAIKATSITLWAKPSLVGSTSLQAYPKFDFKGFELTGKAALEAAYEPEVAYVGKLKLYVGGEPKLTFGLPGEFFRELAFKAYAGVETEFWTFKSKSEYIFVDYSYPASANRGLSLRSAPTDVEGAFIPANTNATGGWKPVDRPWRESGGEVFLAGSTVTAKKLDANATEELDQFARMGKSASPGAVFTPVSDAVSPFAFGPARLIVSDPVLTAQTELPLLGNVYPNSEPALAAKGDKLMMLYVRDNGAASPVQFTEVAATYFDGSAWSTPAPVAGDPRGQFEPQVAFDGQGNAVAVWTRIKDAAFAGTNLGAMAATMEIVSSKWDSGTGTWSAATALTDNAFLDHKPLLAGPLSDGDLILTWRENQSNLLLGTGAAGAAGNTRIMTRRWDSATDTWGAAEDLVADLADEQSVSLAARGDSAGDRVDPRRGW